MVRAARWAAAVLLGAVIVALGGWGAFLLSPLRAPGLLVDGERLPATGELAALLEAREGVWRDEAIQVEAGVLLVERRRGELGGRRDLAHASTTAGSVGKSGAPWRDIPALWDALRGEIDIPLQCEVDEEPVAALVSEIAARVDREPRPPTLDERGQVVSLSVDGARLDREAATLRIAEAVCGSARAIAIPVQRLSSGVGEEALPPRVVHREPVELTRYTTRYGVRGAERSRAHNVELAAEALDGAIIGPRDSLSFNEAVGPRTASRGYRVALVIVAGEMVDGLGGGVCQVASTLHAAALLAGFDIVEHRPHSRPSSYIAMGLDATVVWPEVDLVVRNPYPFPVRVRTRARDGELEVGLFGDRAGNRRVSWSRRVLSTEDFEERRIEDETLGPGVERVTERGVRGFVVLRSRTISDPAGIRVEERTIRYPPADRIIRFGPEALAALPPNPFGVETDR